MAENPLQTLYVYMWGEGGGGHTLAHSEEGGVGELRERTVQGRTERKEAKLLRGRVRTSGEEVRNGSQ